MRRDQAFAYVPSRATNQLFVVDMAAHSVVQTIATGTQPSALSFNPDGSKAYIALGGGGVGVYDVDAATGTLTSVTTVATGGGSRSIVVSADGTRAYAVNQVLDQVNVIDTAINTVLTNVTVGDQPLSGAISPDGSRLYISNFTDSTLSVVDTATNTVMATLNLDFGGTNGRGPDGVEVSPDGAYVYVANRTTGNITIIDSATNTNVGIVSSGSQTNSIAISPDGTALYASVQGAGDHVAQFTIDPATGLLTANGSTATGDSPVGIGFCNSSRSGNPLANGGTFVANTGQALGCAGSTANANGATLFVNSANGTITTPLSLGANGITVNTNGNNVTFAGTISGTGVLTNTGSGTVILQAASTYSGATAINSGTLAAGAANVFSPNSAFSVASGATLDLGGFDQIIGGLSGSGTVVLGSGTLTAGGNNASSIFSGTIGGTGGLTKTGSGMLTLNGASTFSGITTVSGGTLAVGDDANHSASIGGSATIEGGARLIGHGIVGGSVFNQAAGTLAPGGSIGTLTVSGNYVQGDSGMLEIEVSPTDASRLAVGGVATLDGALGLVYQAGTYIPRSRVIVTADGGLRGSFADINGNAPDGFRQTVHYRPTQVTLYLLSETETPDGATFYTALGTAALQTGGEAGRLLLRRLAGEAPQDSSVAMQPARGSVQVAASGDDSLAGLVSGRSGERNSWAWAYGSLTDFDGNNTAPGFDTRTGGFLIGRDLPRGNGGMSLGLAAGYSHTEVTEGGVNDGTLDTLRAAAYGGWFDEPIAVGGTLGYAYHAVDAERLVNATGDTADTDYGIHEVSAALQLAAPRDAGTVQFLPRAGVQYLRLWESDFAEDGAQGFNLSGEDRVVDSLRPFIALSASRPCVTDGGTSVVPAVELSYSRDLLDAAPGGRISVDGYRYASEALEPARDRFAVGGSVEMALDDWLDARAAYEATLPVGNVFGQAFQVSLSFRF